MVKKKAPTVAYARGATVALVCPAPVAYHA